MLREDARCCGMVDARQGAGDASSHAMDMPHPLLRPLQPWQLLRPLRRLQLVQLLQLLQLLQVLQLLQL
jgi:hypothetical protein